MCTFGSFFIYVLVVAHIVNSLNPTLEQIFENENYESASNFLSCVYTTTICAIVDHSQNKYC